MRIEPELVLELYKKNNFKPRTGAFCQRDIDDKTTCALGILYYEAHKDIPENSTLIYQWGYDFFGKEFTEGLWRGFDDSKDLIKLRGERGVAERLEGYQNGLAIGQFVFNNGVKNEN